MMLKELVCNFESTNDYKVVPAMKRARVYKGDLCVHYEQFTGIRAP